MNNCFLEVCTANGAGALSSFLYLFASLILHTDSPLTYVAKSQLKMWARVHVFHYICINRNRSECHWKCHALFIDTHDQNNKTPFQNRKTAEKAMHSLSLFEFKILSERGKKTRTNQFYIQSVKVMQSHVVHPLSDQFILINLYIYLF